MSTPEDVVNDAIALLEAEAKVGEFARKREA